MSELSRPAWHAQAACRGHPVEVFFAGPFANYRAAAELCASCPVRHECDVEGELLPAPWRNHGFRAGLSPQQRIVRRRVARAGRVASG